MIRSGNVGHPLGSWGCADYFAIEPHGLATTHLDALCHHFYRGKMYNDFDTPKSTSRARTSAQSTLPARV